VGPAARPSGLWPDPGTHGRFCSWRLATAALAEWPVLSVNVVNPIHPLGERVPWRQAFFDTSWRRWEFWLFSAVLSWAWVAVIEELFFRGYCQRRLAEDWGNGAAIVGTACLFTFAHNQYLLPNEYSVAMIARLCRARLGGNGLRDRIPTCRGPGLRGGSDGGAGSGT
jgi:membrane protease YdiL (CAAX protease family)